MKKPLVMIVSLLALNGCIFAGESLDIKGDFGSALKNGMPAGWEPNKPVYWEDGETIVSLNAVEGTEKNALQVTSQTKAVHLYTNKKWPVATGDQSVIKAMVKGTGNGQLGVYTYPGGGYISKTFQATGEWAEFIAEVIIPKIREGEIDEIRAVIAVSPGSSIEFMDVTAEIVK